MKLKHRSPSVYIAVSLCMAMLLCCIASNNVAFSEPIPEDADSAYALYREYVKVVEEISETYDAEIEFVPFEEFDSNEMYDIDTFRDMLIAVAKLTDPQHRFDDEVTVKTIYEPYYDPAADADEGNRIEQYVIKQVSVPAGTHSVIVNIEGGFGVYYDNSVNRPMFNHCEVTDIYCSAAGRVWTTTAIGTRLIDRNTTYHAAAQGDITIDGVTWSGREISAEFHCDPDGQVTAN